jgi:beta-galactosidase/beta-glucuronidase
LTTGSKCSTYIIQATPQAVILTRQITRFTAAARLRKKAETISGTPTALERNINSLKGAAFMSTDLAANEIHSEKETQTDKLTVLLERLERQLQLPRISGELVSWTEGVKDILSHIGEHLQYTLQQDHPKTYGAILKNNTELASKVEQMKSEDAEVHKAYEHLVEEVNDLMGKMGDDVRDEALFEPKRLRLVETGLAFVLRTRKQRVAVSTWMTESLRRETGTGD